MFGYGELNGDVHGGWMDEDQIDPDAPPSFRRRSRPFVRDPLYYHERVKVRFENSTPKAYQLRDKRGLYWVPKALIRFKRGVVFQWHGFSVKYLKRGKYG